tara:strand:+ start:989 stop:1891 length:903 start_codon:yes stop_codon:yes gene_type:complete
MSQTNIEYFNSTLKLFVLNVIKIYPEYKDGLNEYYKDLLDSEQNNEDKYVKRFVRKFGEFKSEISRKDDSLFSETICFLKNVDFKDIWENEKTTLEIKNTIWKYLQTLLVIGETIISDSDKIKSLVDNLQKTRSGEELDEDISEENKAMLDMLKNLSENSKNKIDENMLSDGLIGNLAKELAEDINMDDLNLDIGEDANVGDIFGKIMSGDNPMKFMNLIQNVGNKIQSKLEDGNIDQSKLLSEATSMMGMLGNNNPLFDNLLNKAKTEMQQTQANAPNYNNPTRDRLRKKLEQRKKNKK